MTASAAGTRLRTRLLRIHRRNAQRAIEWPGAQLLLWLVIEMLSVVPTKNPCRGTV